ncbi:hypothetical protein INT43_007761 [Umbelopsis isabellina]|uniref:Uncharacterized protein n=1 Tax=Mortierella isabellina TaxID=91625 RepID=A0A8H7PNU7_MORIS|nr:hypothetical protein INT43_007761 [Umbelopsis isabellina]
MLRSALVKRLIARPPVTAQYNSIRLMSDKKVEQIEETTVRKTPLALPASTGADDVTKVDVNTSFKLDELGPVVVNENGTISRIDNWHEMSDIEKSNVNRILLKRNKQRLERLKGEREAAGQDS